MRLPWHPDAGSPVDPPRVHQRPGDVLAVCHPDWRGVRAAALAHDDTVVETASPDRHADEILALADELGASCLVVHGWPPGSGALVGRARRAGMATRVVLHASPAQHGAEAGEAQVADEVWDLARTGVVERVGFVKVGVAEAMAALGWPATYTPNRTPVVGTVERRELGPGLHVGVFGEAFWRKNLVTQLCAAALLDDVTVHLLQAPPVRYVADLRTVVHGVLPRDDFLILQASVDLNLHVTLSECHPLTPIESYLCGVPCLLSRTSSVFASDPDLWQLTTVDRVDDPAAIAQAASQLVSQRAVAVRAAARWMASDDESARRAWRSFTTG